MATRALKLHVTEILNLPIEQQLDIDFQPASNSPGGTAMEAKFPLAGETDFMVEGIQCREGPGTLYTVRIRTRNFPSYAFVQLILEQKKMPRANRTFG